MPEENLNNLKIVPGKNIPYHKNSRVNCSFSYIEFKDVETVQFEKNPEESEELKRQLHTVMSGKNGLIWMRPIGGTYGTGKLDPGRSGLKIEILSPKDKEKYNKFPCGMATPAGSIVPQILVPTAFYKPIDHGMTYPASVTVTNDQSSRYGKEGGSSGTSDGGDDGGDTPDAQVGKGYDWAATEIDRQWAESGYSEAYISKKLSLQSTYGERDGANKAVTNEHSVKKGIDTPVINRREYVCDLSETPAGPGSCAICYKFIQYNEVGDGIKDDEKEQVPAIIVKLAGYEDNEEESGGGEGEGAPPEGGGGDGGGNPEDALEEDDAVVLEIPQNGEALGAVEGFVGQGAMSLPDIDLMPPQCKKNENDYTMKPVYFYPIYSGFLMTNSAVNNLKSGSNGIFIKYNNAVMNPIYTARITGVVKSDEVNKWIEKDKNTELMKWFPSLYQETETKDDIALKIPRFHNIKFGKKVAVTWMKATGRFGYCPVFFHRSIKFTYYFKGEYLSENETGGKYRFYPLVCANLGDNTDSNSWTGIKQNGATCISEQSKSIEGDSPAIRLVSSDPDTEESIYAVDFVFEADSFQRYPIEIFGAVAVYERPDFQFEVENGNGSFEFDKKILSVFTDAREEQDYFNTLRCSSPDVGDYNNAGGLNSYFGLLTSVNLSASEDGVSGSMTLDGYPLEQGIKVLKQDQSIGEVDFAVKLPTLYNSGSTTPVPLFSGYGMEISTSDSESNYGITVQLHGVNKKMEDMQLICCPFWDGDRLEMISAYFEEYLRMQIKMLDYTVESYALAKAVTNNLYDPNGTWRAEPNTIVNQQLENASIYTFRVPRSIDWRSPKVAFPTGMTCLAALKELGKMTGCHCIPQLDGSIVFYELNNYGYPFYVDNQLKHPETIVQFLPSDIVSVTMSPSLAHKFNALATFGLLQKKDENGNIMTQNDIQYGAFYTKTNAGEGDGSGSLQLAGVNFPWSKMSVQVESAMLTKPELAQIHANRIIFATSEIYQGSIQVRGNAKVNHIYQVINVCGVNFFVISIEHAIDLSTKTWTTNYGIQCINFVNQS